MAKPTYNNPKAFIESFDERLQGKLAVKIFVFCITLGGWKDMSYEDYWSRSSIYNSESLAFKFRKELQSEPFFLNDFVIDSMKENTIEWITESCIIWDDKIKASKK
jgi:hypothetical protein